MTDTHIFFVADGERLEWQSWLLAASLAHAHRGRGDVHLYAYASSDWLLQIGPVTRAIYAEAGVDLRALPEPPNWAKPYPHGNKIVAATDPRGPGRGIFLDTDMICLKPLTELADLPATHIAAAPEGRPTWGPDDRWQRAYDHFGLPLPTSRVRLLRGDRPEHLPYFNAGLVAMPEDAQPDGKRFADHWLETALDFDHKCKIANKRPWLDQITLPLAIARFGYTAHVLDESWNHALSHRGSAIDQTPDAHILHYHRFMFLRAAPQWPGILQRFFDLVPRAQHPAATDRLREMNLLP
ncbi:MAG: hypothetical protein ACMUJJ_12785 [Roseicyclus sp.]|uniref:hypothetical protein n=1 Tax=Roseicyclus sp. TaxID=1914329 RepID=UPI003A8ABC4C